MTNAMINNTLLEAFNQKEIDDLLAYWNDVIEDIIAGNATEYKLLFNPVGKDSLDYTPMQYDIALHVVKHYII